jgi:hypothetical protein
MIFGSLGCGRNVREAEFHKKDGANPVLFHYN